MLSDDELDGYVTSLLKNQAAKQAAAYSEIGFRAFLKNAEKEGPVGKPNTRFLKNIVRDVDGYNAALARKEEKESRERLKELRRRDGESMPGNKDEYRSGRKAEGDDWRVRRERDRSRSPPRGQRGSDGEDRDRRRKRRREDSEDEGKKESRNRKSSHRHRSRRDESEEDYRSRRRKERRSRRDEDDEDEKRRARRERHRDRDDQHSHRRQRRDSRRSRSPERSRERHHHRKSTREKHGSPHSDTSPRRSTRYHKEPPDDVDRNRRHNSDSPDSIGPTAPVVGPEFLHAKGRGRMNGGTLDAKFSENYDPRTDVNDHDESDSDDKYVLDDWGLALRALRARQSYISSGAMTERLNETQNQSQVSSWPTYSKGEREWDKGKVLLDDGSVGVKVWNVDKPV